MGTFWMVTHRCDQPHHAILFQSLFPITQSFISVYFISYSPICFFSTCSPTLTNDWPWSLISGLVSLKIPLTFTLNFIRSLFLFQLHVELTLVILLHAANNPIFYFFLLFQPSNPPGYKILHDLFSNTCKSKATHRTNWLTYRPYFFLPNFNVLCRLSTLCIK